MNEEDQILILDLLDNSLEGGDLKKALNLLESDSDLRAFYEESKGTINQLQGELHSPQYLAMEDRLKDFIIKDGENNFSIFKFLGIKNFSHTTIGSVLSINNALVASFSFAFALFITPNIIQQGINLDSKNLYVEEMVSSSVRSSSAEESLANPGFINDGFIENLINSGKKTGVFSSPEGLEIKIIVEDAFNQKGKKYYFGSLSDNKGNKKLFTAVISETVQITYSR